MSHSGATFSGVEANVVVDALTGSGTVSSGFPGDGYANFTFGVNGGSGTFAGVLADGAAPGNFVKAGAGIETLSGNNTYTGTTTVSGGTLVLSGNAISHNGNITISNNADLAFNTTSGNLGFTQAITGTGSVILNVNGNTSASGGGDPVELLPWQQRRIHGHGGHQLGAGQPERRCRLWQPGQRDPAQRRQRQQQRSRGNRQPDASCQPVDSAHHRRRQRRLPRVQRFYV